MEEKVLVLGDDTRSFLTIVRSLGRKGIKLHAAPANFRSPALYSRYIAKVHDVPPWLGEGAGWLASIAGLLRIERYDLVIPCNETVLLPLQHYRRELSAFARLAIPDDDAIAILFDKHNTRELARQIGVPVATGRLARPNDVAENVLTEFGGLLVVKPRRSYSLEKLATRGQAEVITARARLTRLLSETAPNELVFEQFFYGNGIGISVLANRGRLLQAFEHHRVREIAGASFYRRSAPLTPELVQASEAIVAALDYTGIAMFEFKRSPDGSWILLEVNARPWGSMPLPVALGIDFPYRWYRLLVAGEETPAFSYRTGVYGRNLIPDLRQSLVEARTRQLAPIATASFGMGRIAELLRILTGREVNDVLVRDDLRPGLLELLEIAWAVRRRLKKRWPGAASRRRRHARARVEAVGEAEGDPRIIFVCQGNICRSPFAERLLRARVSHSRITIGSAGMMPQPGRPSPALALQAAAAHGVDLTLHRSAWLTRDMANSASLLVVFDDVNRSAVLDRHLELEVPIILLGDVAGIGEVPDPVGGDAAVFGRVYDQIAVAIAELASLMRQNCHVRA
jgi:protein-tyrosine-phosphatase/predicted ATP-grasp superfamily ATP-dependent carboligase